MYKFASYLTIQLWLIAGVIALGSLPARASNAPSVQLSKTCPALLSHKLLRLQDEVQQDLCQYAGKVIVVVNTASFCGFTSQYKELEALHAAREKQGLVVLGFPSNDFGSQEPESNKKIAEFCANTFGVKFPMFAKSAVKGEKRLPLYAMLEASTSQTPKWNFHKYVIARDGKTVRSFESSVSPVNVEFVAEIERQLKRS